MKPWLPFVALFLVGCGSIQQVMKPVALSGEAREICLIENPAVRESFLPAYQTALSAMVRVPPPGSPVASCPLTSTYTANWRRDLSLYLAYANMKVFQNGQRGDEVLYDSLGDGASTSSRFNAAGHGNRHVGKRGVRL